MLPPIGTYFKRSAPGIVWTGLGVTIVKQMVQAHGGAIWGGAVWVESKPGKG